MDVLITRLDPDVPLPSTRGRATRALTWSAAEDVDLAPGERAVVRTGIAIALPAGLRGVRAPALGAGREARGHARQRAGHDRRGYRGEIKVILLNTDPARPVSFRRGDRIAQLVVQRVEQ